jgi:hypothetical protein
MLPLGVGVGVERSLTYSRTSLARSLKLLLRGLDPVLSPVAPAAAADSGAVPVTPVAPTLKKATARVRGGGGRDISAAAAAAIVLFWLSLGCYGAACIPLNPTYTCITDQHHPCPPPTIAHAPLLTYEWGIGTFIDCEPWTAVALSAWRIPDFAFFSNPPHTWRRMTLPPTPPPWGPPPHHLSA